MNCHQKVHSAVHNTALKERDAVWHWLGFKTDSNGIRLDQSVPGRFSVFTVPIMRKGDEPA